MESVSREVLVEGLGHLRGGVLLLHHKDERLFPIKLRVGYQFENLNRGEVVGVFSRGHIKVRPDGVGLGEDPEAEESEGVQVVLVRGLHRVKLAESSELDAGGDAVVDLGELALNTSYSGVLKVGEADLESLETEKHAVGKEGHVDPVELVDLGNGRAEVPGEGGLDESVGKEGRRNRVKAERASFDS